MAITGVVLLVVAAALAGVVVVADPIAITEGLPWWAVAFLFAVTDAFVVRIKVFDRPHAVSASEVPLVIGLVFLTPGWLLVARLVGAVSALPAENDRDPAKIVVNLGIAATEALVAIGVFRLLASGGAGATEVLTLSAGVAAALAAAIAAFAIVTFVLTVPLTGPPQARDVLIGHFATFMAALVGVGAVVAFAGAARLGWAVGLLVVAAVVAGARFSIRD